MSEAEQEILNRIISNKNEGVKTTLYSLLEHFEKMPYGWPFAAILCLLARLHGMAKVEIILDGKSLDDSNLEKFIRNSSYHNNIIIVPTKVPPISTVKKLKGVPTIRSISPRHRSMRRLWERVLSGGGKRWIELEYTSVSIDIRF